MSSITETEAPDEARERGLFTLRSLAAYLHVSRNHLRRMVNQGRLPPPFYASERRPLWRREMIDVWISEREAMSVGKPKVKDKRIG